MRLTDFKALTFDCYGTLIDWEAGMMQALNRLVGKSKRKLMRDLILEAHARHESHSSVKRRQSATAIFCQWSTSDWPRNGASR